MKHRHQRRLAGHPLANRRQHARLATLRQRIEQRHGIRAEMGDADFSGADLRRAAAQPVDRAFHRMALQQHAPHARARGRPLAQLIDAGGPDLRSDPLDETNGTVTMFGWAGRRAHAVSVAVGSEFFSSAVGYSQSGVCMPSHQRVLPSHA